MRARTILKAALAAFVVAFCGGDLLACTACGTPEGAVCVYDAVESSPAEAGPFTFYDTPEPVYRRNSASVPEFSSKPGEHATLFLDFNGVDFGSTTWGGKSPGQRPAYDINGDASFFSREELSRIEQIWSRVAEAYSMFNINVTTVDPGNYNRRESAHVVISGSNSWYGGGGGVAFVGSFAGFTSMVRHTSWVFPNNLRGGDAKVVADAAIHEAGHMFGLSHQSTYNDAGSRTSTYDDNFDSVLRSPNLGVAYNAGRGLWAEGAASNGFSTVDELNIIGSSNNAFRYVTDEPGTGFHNAQPIVISDTPLRGVIDRSTDSDYYSFSLDQRSEIELLVDVAEYGPNLDARLLLFNSEFSVLADIDPSLTTARSSLTASFAGVLDEGEYYIGVTSHGGYTYDNGPRDRFLQDAGQYFLSGSVTAIVPEPAALLLLAVAASLAARRRV